MDKITINERYRKYINTTKKKIIIYGTGSLSEKIAGFFENVLDKKIEFYLDSYIEKKEENIYSPSRLRNLDGSEYLIVIASSFYDDIYKLLIEKLENTSFEIVNGYEIYEELSKVSFSQQGEDLIINMLFNRLGLHTIKYIDIGSNHPMDLSNTYFFYQFGSNGLCIEPNTKFNDSYQLIRPKDILLNSAIGSETNEAIFYEMSESGLSTFNFEEVEKYLALDNGISLINQFKVQMTSYNDLVEEYFDKNEVDFLSIDIENYELEVLKTINFNMYSPKIICLETLIYGTNSKNEETINFLIDKNYRIVADTYVNTIFLREDLFEKLA